jgi:starch-binding outer membrane protein SusE/F
MKHITKILLLALSAFALWSCDKDEHKVYFEGGTAPVLTSTVTGNIPMAFVNADKEALRVNWTNPDFGFTTGGSSQNVSYLLEIDTTGANFTNPNRQTIAISNNLSKTFTQSELNDYLLNQLLLVPEMSHNIEMRVKATIAGAPQTQVVSNVLKYTVVPYRIPPKVAPPASGELYIVGSATPGGDATGWNNPVPVPSQKFTRISPTLYELTIALNADKSYLFLPVNGSWDAKYGAMGGNNSNNPDGDDFKAGGGDLKAPAVSGTYKITVDFQRGKFTLTKI